MKNHPRTGGKFSTRFARFRPAGLTINLGSAERSLYGCTVTAVDEKGCSLSLSRAGTTLEALKEIVGVLDRLDGVWKVRSISTPQSVYRDMQGTRQPIDKRGGGGLKLDIPEPQLLAKIRRLDLWGV